MVVLWFGQQLQQEDSEGGGGEEQRNQEDIMETTDRSTTDLNMQEDDGPLLSYYLPSNDMQTLGRVGTWYLL